MVLSPSPTPTSRRSSSVWLNSPGPASTTSLVHSRAACGLAPNSPDFGAPSDLVPGSWLPPPHTPCQARAATSPIKSVSDATFLCPESPAGASVRLGFQEWGVLGTSVCCFHAIFQEPLCHSCWGPNSHLHCREERRPPGSTVCCWLMFFFFGGVLRHPFSGRQQLCTRGKVGLELLILCP